jgi:ADP-ribosyl-[dinitrogen reductase] hydrolase
MIAPPTRALSLRDRYAGALLGLAAGDAVGTTLEFQPRGSFTPIADMVGGGPFSLPAGAWTDDTSMALCLAASLVETGQFDAVDQMQRYVRWWRTGYMSSIGHCFDIGNATSSALSRFEISGNPWAGSTNPNAAGNGCLMRLAPVVMAYFSDPLTAIDFAGESSRTTHGADECLGAARLFGAMLWKALDGQTKDAILRPPFATTDEDLLHGELPRRVMAIARGDYLHKRSNEIEATGYVIHALEAALWCFATTGDFSSAVLAAANLGQDADTTAAITGQLAGAHYGVDAIPAQWRDKLVMRRVIEELADSLLAMGTAATKPLN